MSPRVLTLPENTQGRDFVIGDIHGAFDLLDQALLAVVFDPAKDRLIAVGDLVDRGPQSAACLRYLAQPWFHTIRGNHEEAFLYLYKNGILNVEGVIRNLPNGMAWLLEADTAMLDDIRRAFEALPVALEIKTPQGIIGFVHADVPEGMDWETFKQKLELNDHDTIKTAVWSRARLQLGNEQGVDGIHRVFFGHTPVEGGPRALGNCFYIDTGAVFKVVDPDNSQDFYMALIDIKANAEDITHPAATSQDLIRTAFAPPEKPPAGKPAPPAP